MILESGFIVAAGLLLTFMKCSWPLRMWMLSHPLLMDVIVFVVLTVVHWGTFYGVMAATTGAMMCSLILMVGRWLWGHTTPRMHQGQRRLVYKRGLFNMAKKLGIAPPRPEN